VPGRMEGKKVVVIGAGQPADDAYGNGRAIAVLMAREGGEVFAVDLVAARAEATVDEIRGAGGTAHPFAADVGRADECAGLASAAAETMSGIDVLVNNVGITTGDGGPMRITEETWQQIFDVNLRSMWLTCRTVIPVMQAQGHGCITNMSSTGARMGVSVLFAYGIAKAGVDALTHALAREYAPDNIRVNSVLPGQVATPLGLEPFSDRDRARTRDEREELRARNVPLGRMGTAWDVAHAVLFLSSDDAGFITGVNLPVDGGALTIVANYSRPRNQPADGSGG
jgi:NAD(P)-dependent dehydrogenase (short-subunit alcohol dehydrogenase family)